MPERGCPADTSGEIFVEERKRLRMSFSVKRIRRGGGICLLGLS
jgi:hypothetical protein